MKIMLSTTDYIIYENHKIHCESGPAMKIGKSLRYFINGIELPKEGWELVTAPSFFPKDEIEENMLCNLDVIDNVCENMLDHIDIIEDKLKDTEEKLEKLNERIDAHVKQFC